MTAYEDHLTPTALMNWQIPVLAGAWLDLKNQFSLERMAPHSGQPGRSRTLASFQSMAGLAPPFCQHLQE
jgi:hypothetical protein